MIIGIDIDDTITRHPGFFAFISQALMDAGHEVYIISFRDGQEETEAAVRQFGVAFTKVILPSDQDLQDDFYAWKAKACRQLGVEVLFEDMPEVVNELDPSVLALIPFDRELGQITYDTDHEFM